MKQSNKERLFPEVALRMQYFGQYIRIARKRRRMTMVEVGVRLNLGYQTVVRMERGDPGVSFSAYLSALWLFDLDKQLIESIHPDHDEAGKKLEFSRMPERIGKKRVTRSSHDF